MTRCACYNPCSSHGPLAGIGVTQGTDSQSRCASLGCARGCATEACENDGAFFTVKGMCHFVKIEVRNDADVSSDPRRCLNRVTFARNALITNVTSVETWCKKSSPPHARRLDQCQWSSFFLVPFG
jgi:hypothetical protein